MMPNKWHLKKASHWRILLEEISLQMEYIKIDDNSVADALSRLDRKGTDEKAEPAVDYILALFESDANTFPLEMETISIEQKLIINCRNS